MGCVDEILIIDTGSTDNSVDIARSYGARVIIPDNLDEYFVDTEFGPKINFSKTRNLTMSEASGDWHLLIDADEELKGSAKKLKRFLSSMGSDVEAIAITFKDIQKDRKYLQFPPPRIFRKGKCQFEGIVHNRPIFKEPAIMFTELEIWHYGYELSPEEAEEKHRRTLGLLRRQLKDDPKAFDTYFYLAQVYGQTGEFDRCIEFCVKYIRNLGYLKKFNHSIYYTLIQACMASDNKVMADKWLGEAIKKLPDDIDIAQAIIDYGVWMKKSHIVVKGCEKFLNCYLKLKQNPLTMGSRFIYNFNERKLCYALFHLTTIRFGEGRFFYDQLIKEIEELEHGVQDAIKEDVKKYLDNLQVSVKLQNKKPRSKKAEVSE